MKQISYQYCCVEASLNDSAGMLLRAFRTLFGSMLITRKTLIPKAPLILIGVTWNLVLSVQKKQIYN